MTGSYVNGEEVVGVFVFIHGVWMCRRQEKVCPGCISETIRCRKLIHGRDIGLEGGGVGRCATSWCDFDLAVVTLTYESMKCCPGHFSEIIRRRKLILGRDIG